MEDHRRLRFGRCDPDHIGDCADLTIDLDQIRPTAIAVDCLLLRHSPEGGGAWQLFLLLPLPRGGGAFFIRLLI
jgi:hypothetical protein